MPDLGIVQTALDQAVTEGVFPGAVLAVRCGDRPISRFYAGHLSTVPPGSPVSTSTIYDLASLTKPLATVTALVLLMQKGSCRLDDRVADHLPECADVSIGSAMIRHLLTHSSGLPGWRGFYERLSPIGQSLRRLKRENRPNELCSVSFDLRLRYMNGARAASTAILVSYCSVLSLSEAADNR